LYQARRDKDLTLKKHGISGGFFMLGETDKPVFYEKGWRHMQEPPAYQERKSL